MRHRTKPCHWQVATFGSVEAVRAGQKIRVTSAPRPSDDGTKSRNGCARVTSDGRENGVYPRTTDMCALAFRPGGARWHRAPNLGARRAGPPISDIDRGCHLSRALCDLSRPHWQG